MKAVTRLKYGNPDVLQVKELDLPILKKKEVLVKVHVTTVNRTDCGILTGKPYIIRAFTGLRCPSNLVTGTDFAGTIEKIGSAVTNFKEGDRVWGLNDEGLQSQAEYMAIDEDKGITKIPDGISFEHAVASAEGAHYAYNFTNKIKLNKESTVLVNGATGAIGSSVLQLLKYQDIQVTAVGNTDNVDLLFKLGANRVIDYLKDDFTKDKQRYDFICDTVGNKSFELCKPIMNEKAIYVSSELGPKAENLYLPLFTLFSKQKVVFPVPVKVKNSLAYLSKLLDERKFQAVIDRTYSINEVQDAYRYVMKGHKTGNVLISFR